MNSNNNKLIYGAVLVVFLLTFVVLGLYLYRENKALTPEPVDTSNQNEDEDSGAPDVDIDALNTSFKSDGDVAVTLTSPTRGATVSSPLAVSGKVPGSWSHEGSFVVRLVDADGVELAEGVATIDGDWMSVNQVPFTATLTFDAPASGSMGLLILEKANPSDLPENGDSLSVPIQF